MTFDHLHRAMVSWGFAIKPHEYRQFQEYTQKMLERDRVMIIYDDNEPQAIIFYYLTNDYLNLYKKSVWHIPPDDPHGHQIYLDKMVCRKWTRDLRNVVKRSVEKRFPDVKEFVYHRAPFDRCVKILTEVGELSSKI